jgi:hypothetical protein
MKSTEETVGLVHKFYPLVSGYHGSKKNVRNAKRAALVAVEFAREQFRLYSIAECDISGEPDNHFDFIKQEIEKL